MIHSRLSRLGGLLFSPRELYRIGSLCGVWLPGRQRISLRLGLLRIRQWLLRIEDRRRGLHGWLSHEFAWSRFFMEVGIRAEEFGFYAVGDTLGRYGIFVGEDTGYYLTTVE